MRYYAYAGTSMVLATGVIIRALHQRANFYSACVYLAQSNACLMVKSTSKCFLAFSANVDKILTNLALLGVCTTMLALQRLFYGPLRPIEVEQLYEKAWFAITETCLAMTIFREEVGGWFLVMFVSLLVGKVWGWIGEGRVDILEQQPPTNPRLFHARLSFSLVMSTLFDLYMLRYSIETVLLQARPNMMVMFAFEFAVLTVTSLSTAARYSISLHEAAVIKHQISVHRAQMRHERDQAQQQLDIADSSSGVQSNDGMRTQDDIESMDIDVPGWEEKGRWVFYLDLTTDFFKLVLYLTFFCVLCMFYGMPIHIIRDVALTIRSFYKRINDFIRYRQATRDMNARYPDATADEVAREDVCIICREDMRPWRQPENRGGQLAGPAGANAATFSAVDERLRPKKLPCGHILHFACLRSWLERQQNCPTCRRPVLIPSSQGQTQGANPLNQDNRARTNLEQPRAPVAGQHEAQQPVAAQNVFQFGPFRLAFGARHADPGFAHQGDIQMAQPNQHAHIPAVGDFQRLGNVFGFLRQAPTNQRAVASSSQTSVPSQLHHIEQQLMREINGIRLQADQLFLVRALQGELARLRIAQATPGGFTSTGIPTANQIRPTNTATQEVQPFHTPHVFSTLQQQQALGSGHQDLPSGLSIPNGWTVLPLQRLPSGANLGVSTPNVAYHTQRDPQSNIRSHTSQSMHSQPGDSRIGESISELNSVQATHEIGDEGPVHLEAAFAQDNASQSSSEVMPSTPTPCSEHGRTQGARANHSTSYERSEAGAQVPTPKLEGLSDPGQANTLPLWGSKARGLNGSQAGDQKEHSELARSANRDSSSNKTGSISAGDNPQAKGKGKVVTVEDEIDNMK